MSFRCEGVVRVQPGQKPQRRPLNRHDSHVAEQMVERAAELARDSRARTRHAAVLVKDGSLLAWGTNGVPYPGEDHCYCKFGELGVNVEIGNGEDTFRPPRRQQRQLRRERRNLVFTEDMAILVIQI